MREIVIACHEYDRTRPFIHHQIGIDGVDYTCLKIDHRWFSELDFRMTRYAEFDVAEVGLSNYCIASDAGDDRYIALPVFLARMFAHGNFYVRKDSGIESPAQLKGKRIGASEYGVGPAIWGRGLMQDEYGVNPWDVEWVVLRPEKTEGIPYDRRIQITRRTTQRGNAVLDMQDALLKGEIDAYMHVSTALCEGVRSLFSNVLEAEQAYFQRSGIFPIQKALLLRRSLFEDHPWLARSLFKAFYEAKTDAERALATFTSQPITTPWITPMLEQARAVMGSDPWPYGVQANTTSLTALTRYLVEQGLTKTQLDVREIFAPVQWTNADIPGGS